jgi:hypothetical protein
MRGVVRPSGGGDDTDDSRGGEKEKAQVGHARSLSRRVCVANLGMFDHRRP